MQGGNVGSNVLSDLEEDLERRDVLLLVLRLLSVVGRGESVESGGERLGDLGDGDVSEHLVGKGDDEVERVDGVNSSEEGSSDGETLRSRKKGYTEVSFGGGKEVKEREEGKEGREEGEKCELKSFRGGGIGD